MYIGFIVICANTIELAIQRAVCSIFFNVPNSYHHNVFLKVQKYDSRQNIRTWIFVTEFINTVKDYHYIIKHA